MSTSVTPSAGERVLRGLAERRDECVAEVVTRASRVDGYTELDRTELDDLTAHIGEGLDAVLAAISEERSLGEADVPFLWPHIHRRTASGVSQADMLAVVRIFQRVVWDAIVELAGHSQAERAAALTLARPLLGYIDVLSDTVAKAFSEAGTARMPRSARAREELLELLLTGTAPEPGPALTAARALGLDAATPLTVAVARVTGAVPAPAELAVAAQLLARAGGRALEPLAQARGAELILVLPTRRPDALPDSRRLEQARARLAARGTTLVLGISTVHAGIAAVPAAYSEACLALEHVPSAGGTLALSTLDVHEYLILRAGDRTAWQLVPLELRRFVEQDAAQGSVLCDTLIAYADCDLSVKLAAQQLHVHPNTVHYRLAKLEQATQLDPRRLRDVAMLVTAVHLHRAGHSG